MFLRENNPYELDEVLFIFCALLSGRTLKSISMEVQRSPEGIRYKFLSYRDKDANGNYTSTTVKPYKVLRRRK